MTLIPFKAGDSGDFCYICPDAVVAVRPVTELYNPATPVPMASVCTLDGKETRVQGTVKQVAAEITP